MKKVQRYLMKFLFVSAMALMLPFTAEAAVSNIKGIDVSWYNGTINWESVKQQGYSFAMLKTGDGAQTGTYEEDLDDQFEANYYGAGNAGIKRGVYHFCCTTTVAGAKREAEYCLKILKGRKLEYPVVYDIEQSGTFKKGKKNTTAIAKAFCDKIKKAGYTPMIYSSDYRLTNDFDWSKLSGIRIWVGSYGIKKPSFSGSYDMWQYTDKGKVPGANTDKGYCDLNYSFMEAERISLNTSKITLGAKETYSLKTSVKPSRCTDSKRYTTSNKRVATVNSSGKITAKKPGRATITVTTGSGKTDTCVVEVKKAPAKVKLRRKSVKLRKGKTYQIKPIISSNSQSNRITYISSRKAVATVDSRGKVKSRKKGVTYITVRTYNKKSVQLTVKVI
ncbi:GH25 family lysozyme [Robinsoniella peoriensis]|uniref:GH25 family lysozyme n=1 Tax=Robinsoniella peoriensis TaxID=180332 RepID=UPI00085CD651|nr:GH25 family lysozyme [Robinsoniella peoriensis]